MICPKCGFDQPESPECARCGIIISRYKGPALGALPPPPPPVADPGPLASAATPPPPPPQTGGTLYGGPAPALAAAGGGTIYQGPMPPLVPLTLGTAPRPAVRDPLTSGKVLGEAFSIYFANFVPFLLLTTVALSPMFAMFALLVSAAAKQDSSGVLSALGLLVLTGVFCWQLATASITYGVFQQMRGADVSIGDCLGKGLSSLFSVIGVVIVQSIGIALGAVLCLIPGLILALRWNVSVPVAVEERLGTFETLRRSSDLTDGYRGTIFGVLFLINLPSNILSRVLGFGVKDPKILLSALGLLFLFEIGLTATATAVMYYRLRSIKESIDVDQIASVFA